MGFLCIASQNQCVKNDVFLGHGMYSSVFNSSPIFFSGTLHRLYTSESSKHDFLIKMGSKIVIIIVFKRDSKSITEVLIPSISTC